MDRVLFSATIAASLEEIRELRHRLEQVVKVCVTEQTLHNNMLLCLAEITTNLVTHGAPSVTKINARFGSNQEGWWLEICDNGAKFNPLEIEPVTELDEFLALENGRGIPLIKQLSDQCEYCKPACSVANRLRLLWHKPERYQKPTILLVEDNAALSRLYSAYLKESFQIETAINGEEALELLAQKKIDLVISDIYMPQMSGLSLRERLNQSKQTQLTPFIFLTGADDHQIKDQAASLGIDDYLLKPVNKAQLMTTVERVLGRSRQVYKQLTDRINRRITSSLSPTLPQYACSWHMAVANRNTGMGGGDLLLKQRQDNQLMLVLVDIMGHDDSAKFFAYAYGGYLRGLMQSQSSRLQPGELLDRLSLGALEDELLSQLTLTCCAASLNPDGSLKLASAGHPPALKISREGVSLIQTGGMLPGLLAETCYQTEQIHVQPGERIALYTDGLFESAADNHGRRHLEDQIMTCLRNTLNLPLEKALAETMTLFDQLAGTPPNDDTTLLLIEPDYTSVVNIEP